MSHFYSNIRGSRGAATRCGTKNSGIVAEAYSYEGGARITIEHRNGEDHLIIKFIDHPASSNQSVTILDEPLRLVKSNSSAMGYITRAIEHSPQGRDNFDPEK